MIRKTIDSISLCLGSDCNLHCSWCYNQANKSKSLDYDSFCLFFNQIIKNHIDTVILIGGEPLVYPRVIEIIELLQHQRIVLATNGIAFSDDNLIKQVAKHNNLSISLSIKGFNEQVMLQTTRVNGFNQLSKAILMLNNHGLTIDYSYVFDYSLRREDFGLFYGFLSNHSIRTLTIGEMRPYFSMTGEIEGRLAKRGIFESFVLYLIERGIDLRVKIQAPFCEYSLKFINYLIREKMLISACSVKLGGALFFDSNLDLVLCESCFDIRLGEFGKDYTDYNSLQDFFLSPQVRAVYNKFKGCPRQKCTDCKYWSICGGGCILNWRE